ncbi:MAG: RimK/LysX family protein [Nanoarchaeota archaeon]
MAEKVILGLTEPVKIKGREGRNADIIARIDTGATSSSIDMRLAEELGLKQIPRSKVVKSASGVKKRSLARARIIIKGMEIEEEFTLADRSQMTYKMLIGQNILRKGSVLIDPSLNVIK